MKFFSLIHSQDDVSPNTKILAPEAFSSLLDAEELLEHAKEDSETFLKNTEEECERLRQEAKAQGFKDGCNEWNALLAFLQQEIQNLRNRVRDSLVQLAVASVKKIIGKELEMHPETIVSIISQALKELTQNKQITIYLNPKDLQIVEQNRPELKKIVEYADTLILTTKPEVTPGGCIIETEAGIVNAQLDVQLLALEKAFSSILKQKDPTVSESESPSSTQKEGKKE